MPSLLGSEGAPSDGDVELAAGSCVPCSDLAPSASTSPAAAAAAAFSSSNFLYLRLLFLAALSDLFFLTWPTMLARLSSPLYRSSRRWARISRACLRFCARERVACDLTTMPVGMCLSCTAEFVLFCILERIWLVTEM